MDLWIVGYYYNDLKEFKAKYLVTKKSAKSVWTEEKFCPFNAFIACAL